MPRTSPSRLLLPRASRARSWTAFALALALGPSLAAQEPPAPPQASKPGIPWSGARGVTESVADIMARQQFSDRVAGPPHVLEKPELGLPEKVNVDPESPAVSEWPGGRTQA